MSAFSGRIRGQKTGVFKVADFPGGREATLTIDYLEEEVEIFSKVVDLLHFTDSRQQLTINQTNAEFLLNTLGDDPEKWKNQRVVLYLAQYEYGNDRGYTIRIKLPGPASKPAVKEGVIIPPSRGDGASNWLRSRFLGKRYPRPGVAPCGRRHCSVCGYTSSDEPPW